MTPSGIEPATFRFVAQRLNHCATAVPTTTTYTTNTTTTITTTTITNTNTNNLIIIK